VAIGGRVKVTLGTPLTPRPRIPVCHVDRVGTADQHFLRIAAAQSAGSAERQTIDDGNRTIPLRARESPPPARPCRCR
jgi:hypothetical protein